MFRLLSSRLNVFEKVFFPGSKKVFFLYLLEKTRERDILIAKKKVKKTMDDSFLPQTARMEIV